MMMYFPTVAINMPLALVTTGMRHCAASFLIFLLSVLFVLPANAANRETWIPDSDSVVLAELPVTDSPQWQMIRALRERLAKQPDNPHIAAELARTYMNMRRLSGDPRYLGYAQAVLAPWWDAAHPPAEILLTRARLKQTQHHFDAALEDLQQLLKMQPRNSQAWLLLAGVSMVKGRYDLAKRACAHLLLQSPALVSTSCVAQVGGMTGKLESSYQLLKQTLLQQAPSKITQTTKSQNSTLQQWAWTMLAEMAVRLDKPQAAEKHFKQALSIEQPDIYLLSAYADFLLANGQAQQVVDLLEDRRQVDALLLRLALAAQMTGNNDADNYRQQMQRRFEAMRRRGNNTHLREAAHFMLDLQHKPAKALTLAQGNWQQQHEMVDAILLARTALAADKPAAAKPVLDWQKQHKVQGVQLKRLLSELQKRGL